MRQSISKTLIDHQKTIKVPMSRVGLVNKVSGLSKKIEQEEGRSPSLERLAKELNQSLEIVIEAIQSCQEVAHLDDKLEYFDSLTFNELVGEDETQTAQLEQEERSIYLNHTLSKLNDRDRKIIDLYYGLEGEKSMNLEQIGKCLGLTRERVRQLRNGALKKMRSYM